MPMIEYNKIKAKMAKEEEMKKIKEDNEKF